MQRRSNKNPDNAGGYAERKAETRSGAENISVTTTSMRAANCPETYGQRTAKRITSPAVARRRTLAGFPVHGEGRPDNGNASAKFDCRLVERFLEKVHAKSFGDTGRLLFSLHFNTHFREQV